MRKFKFIGTVEQANYYIDDIIVGETYPDDHFLGIGGGILISRQRDIDDHWEEVFE